MSGNRNDMLFSLEVSPPPGTWEKIAARLDEEYNSEEIKTGSHIYSIEAMPPTRAWPGIAAALSTGTRQRTPVRAMRRIAVAAVALGIILSGIYFLFLAPGKNTPANIVQSKPQQPAPTQATIPTQEIPPITADVGSSIIGSNILRPKRQAGKEQNIFAAHHFKEKEDPSIRHAEVSLLQPIEAGQTTEVSAPLIRDTEGRIIMDLNTLTASDNRYITVTGPNGQQTRISSKFIPVLSYMNVEPETDEYLDIIMRESLLWKMKFQEWRSLILERASYTPNAGNFLDILELKSLIQEEQ